MGDEPRAVALNDCREFAVHTFDQNQTLSLLSLHVRRVTLRLGHFQPAPLQALEMEIDGFVHVAFDFFPCGPR